jgi:hypothetical protein
LWINIPITRPAAPPNAPAMTARLTRTMYGPPVSMTVPVSPPIASNSQMSRRPATIPTDSGTQVASAARTIAPNGTGAGLGRTAAVSQSGIASASRPGTTASRRRAVRSCRFVMGSSPSRLAPSLPPGLVSRHHKNW